MEDECSILSLLNHENVIKSYGLYWMRDKIHLVLELVEGEEMHELINQSGGLPEKEAITLIYQLLTAMVHLHENMICHRDIKPENILISSDGTLKLIDFGLAVNLTGTDGTMRACVGTQAYQAPEVLIGASYNMSVDLWAAGVTTYTLLSGSKPFGYGPYADTSGSNGTGPTPEQKSAQRAKILNGDFSFTDPIWQNISDNAKDFLFKLMKVRPSDRLSLKEALEHPWITSQEIDLRSFHFQWRSNSRERGEVARRERREQMIAITAERSKPSRRDIEEEEPETRRPTESQADNALSPRRQKSQSVVINRSLISSPDTSSARSIPRAHAVTPTVPSRSERIDRPDRNRYTPSYTPARTPVSSHTNRTTVSASATSTSGSYTKSRTPVSASGSTSHTSRTPVSSVATRNVGTSSGTSSYSPTRKYR